VRDIGVGEVLDVVVGDWNKAEKRAMEAGLKHDSVTKR
jgi:hypothetical protein